MSRKKKNINLFVYGSLRNPAFIESITGELHEGENAALHGYKKFYTHIGFFFILPHPQGRVHGKCYFDVSPESLKKIDHFECEGTLYDRKEVTVTVHGKDVTAHAYIANIIHIRRTFGANMDLALVEKAEKFIEEHAGERIKIIMMPPGEIRSESELVALTRQELFGAEVFNLLNMLMLDKYISNYTIDSRLKIHGLPTLKSIRMGSEQQRYARNYLHMAMSHIVLNQFEECFRHGFRSELFMRMPYCRFTLSMLSALILFNRHRVLLHYSMEENGLMNQFLSKEYWDYAFRAVEIANQFFHEHMREAALTVKEILLEPQHGYIPLGAEMEFSDVGYRAPYQDRPEDPRFDHFKYFLDFDMERRGWKLGGHIDDHTMNESSKKTQGGFLEYSLGKTDFLQKQSRPVTDEPSILARFIKELVSFTEVKPHSLHLVLQEIEEKPFRQENDPEMLMCLLLLGGDFGLNENGILVEKRIYYEETVDQWGNLHFLRENFHTLFGVDEDAQPLRVMEYQFPRLRNNYDYEPLIMALKGFHLGYRPRPMSSVSTSKYLEPAKREVESLQKWAAAVEPLSESSFSTFLGYLEAGLGRERKGKRVHSKRYIARILLEIEKTLILRNEWVRQMKKQAPFHGGNNNGIL